ncbi:MAG: hypothetical protein R3E95_06820 [Thiolinea sp.]
MSTLTINQQVNAAIDNARKTFNGQQHLIPSSEKTLRNMVHDLNDKIEELTTARSSLVEFINHHTPERATYS